MIALGDGVNNSGGYSEGYLELGNTIYTAVVITTVIKSGLEKEVWTGLCFVIIIGSILAWPVVLWIYSFLWLMPSFPGASARDRII